MILTSVSLVDISILKTKNHPGKTLTYSNSTPIIQIGAAPSAMYSHMSVFEVEEVDESASHCEHK